ncbi:aspartate ammonia-lyase [Thermoplasmatales archaeon SW_10_69_26]|nr:MAG: aspartate ammonia-lyase [Thermoplasmatales archaeon SW_10_69_26]
MTDDDVRIEEDTMGEVRVPADALYGAQTQRAVDNFPVSGDPLPARFVRAMGMVKLACARVNRELETVDAKKAEAIAQAAEEVAEGEHDDEFPVDVFQTGSGTSTNMNTNEVLANRATQILGAEVGSKQVHPNDHVNHGQSSNDTIPTALHLATILAVEEDLVPALDGLHQTLEAKAEEFDDVVKVARTHLQDATPTRLGLEFGGYAASVANGRDRVVQAIDELREVAIGGTAVGTGLNAPQGFGELVTEELSDIAGTDVYEAANHFEAQGQKDAITHVSGALNALASSLMKIANDIRLLGSGPRCGLGEIDLPAVQPGSSIMPGKVNPVIPESVVQVGAQVAGNHQVVTQGNQWGQLDLNAMMPLMARNVLESIELLANVSRIFDEKCVAGIEANEEQAESFVEQSTAIVTALNPYIGYEKASKVAKQAFREGKTVRQVVVEEGLMDEDEVDEALDVRAMTEREEN